MVFILLFYYYGLNIRLETAHLTKIENFVLKVL